MSLLGGNLTDPNNCTHWDNTRDNRTLDIKYKNGDIIEMILDLNHLTLSYKVNDKEYNAVFEIEKGEYRAAVTLSTNFNDGAVSSIALLSYQEFY